MRKTLTIAALSTGIILSGASAADARPVHDPVIEIGDCGPGLEDTVFSLTDPRGYAVTCRDEQLPWLYQKPVIRPGFDAWWNPWSWFN